MTLNDEFDYVRAMDYSSVGNVIYSVSDSGIARVWDVNVGKIIAS
jgi:WD40 repeat protein